MQAIPLTKRNLFTPGRVCYLNHHKYEILLFSFILLIFGDTFVPHQMLFNVINIYQNFITGLVIFYSRKSVRLTILCIILASLALDAFAIDFTFINTGRWHGILYLIFFFLVSTQVYKEVLFSKAVSRELLAAVLCGFVLLGLMGTFLFSQIDISLPHSFANAGEGRDLLPNLNYFSFTTLLTIGYGDITPASLIAKRAVMFMGLAGHFYTVFITSIIIGKYLSLKRE